MLDWIGARFGERRVTAVATHFHVDALGGNAALRAAGVRTHGSTHTAKLLAEQGEAMRAATLAALKDRPEDAAAIRDVPLLPPEHLFAPADGLSLDLEGTPVRVLFPGHGHAPDNVVVHLPTLRVLFGGCLVAARDHLGNLADADLEAWPAALRALKALPADHVVPGHGDRTDPALLDHGLRLLEAAAP
jgi:metallo-beta-lactamase class B